jgi:hypothetical protein
MIPLNDLWTVQHGGKTYLLPMHCIAGFHLDTTLCIKVLTTVWRGPSTRHAIGITKFSESQYFGKAAVIYLDAVTGGSTWHASRLGLQCLVPVEGGVSGVHFHRLVRQQRTLDVT